MRKQLSGRYVLATALVLVIGIPAVAVGAGEGRDLVAGKRNPARADLTRETQIIAANGSYGTRQSNKGAGGGAIYGCRSALADEACVRANNLRQGRAFDFETGGNEAGRITVEDASGVPFTTNATGRVVNLNADRVDGIEGADLAKTADVLFAAVADGGTLGANRGATASVKAGDVTTVTFNRDVSACSYTATANGGAPESLAVQAVQNQPAQVRVTEEAGTATAFHLQVIC